MQKNRVGYLFIGLLVCSSAVAAAPAQVGGGEGYTCALGESGRAFCWGSNTSAQIGNGAGMSDRAMESRPTEMAGGFVTVSSGAEHTCGLQADGSAFCWGRNYHGQLGMGVTSNAVSLPVRVRSSRVFRSISAGSAHTCAVDDTGAAWCWGLNQDAQLGRDPRLTFLAATPAQVQTTIQFKTISAGAAHTCAIDVNDEAWCWGSNVGARSGIDINRCGGSVTPPCNFPVPTRTMASEPPLSLRFRSLSAGNLNTCGIDTAGNVQCWGQLYRGSRLTGRPDMPAQVPTVANALSVSVGEASVCAVAGDGGLFCWGKNTHGQLGNGTAAAPTAVSTAPVRVSGTQDYLTVSVGGATACGQAANNVVRCWGANDRGELGVGMGTATSAVPRVVSGLRSAQVGTGGRHVCSLDTAAVTACWGDNLYGQIGHGRRAGTVPPQSVVPTPVPRFFRGAELGPTPGRRAVPPESVSSTLPTKGTVGSLSFSKLALGGQHTCALATNGLAYCWGADWNGQVGSGSRISASCPMGVGSTRQCVAAPTIVSRAPDHVFTDIAAGAAHTCARDSNGVVYCWGSAGFGELGSPVACGSPGTCFRREPMQIQVPFPNRREMVDVAGSDGSTCSVSGAGVVFCWGVIANSSSVPQVMPYPTGGPYVRVGTGAGFACVGARNGAVQCFGDNMFGQLGDGSNTSSPTPTLVTPGFFSSFAVSRSFVCGIEMPDVRCWGANHSGQLGDQTTNNANAPVQVSLGAGWAAAGVGVGFAHACAIAGTGDVRCWGSNANGELGNGMVLDQPHSEPVVVGGGFRVP